MGKDKFSGADWFSNAKKLYGGNRAKIEGIMSRMVWEPLTPGIRLPASPGMAIKKAIDEFKLKADMYSISHEPFGTPDEPDAAWSLVGVRARYKDGYREIYVADGGDVLVPVAAVKVAELTESASPKQTPTEIVASYLDRVGLTASRGWVAGSADSKRRIDRFLETPAGKRMVAIVSRLGAGGISAAHTAWMSLGKEERASLFESKLDEAVAGKMFPPEAPSPEELEHAIRRHFPRSFVKCTRESGLAGTEHYYIRFAILTKEHWGATIHNDPMNMLISVYPSAGGKVEAEMVTGGGLTVKSSDRFMAYSKVKLPWRNFKCDPSQLTRKVSDFFQKAKTVVQDNVDQLSSAHGPLVAMQLESVSITESLDPKWRKTRKAVAAVLLYARSVPEAVSVLASDVPDEDAAESLRKDQGLDAGDVSVLIKNRAYFFGDNWTKDQLRLKEAATDKSLVDRIARKFSSSLRRELSREELAEVNRLNAAESDPDVCHSGDFCDPNELLEAAMSTEEFGLDEYPDFSSNNDYSRLWSVVWDHAKKNRFWA